MATPDTSILTGIFTPDAGPARVIYTTMPGIELWSSQFLYQVFYVIRYYNLRGDLAPWQQKKPIFLAFPNFGFHKQVT